MRHQLISRAAGRTLAHEIGHFLLRSPPHGRAGLMRARQPIVALSERALTSFGLSTVERARLDIGLKAWMSHVDDSCRVAEPASIAQID